MDKLLPCPHCGGFDTLAVSGIQIGTKTTWRTICDAEDSGCGAQGGTALTKHAAAAAWNRRATNAPADPALLALAKFAADVIASHRSPMGRWAQPSLLALPDIARDLGVTIGGQFAPGIAAAIAALLAPDGAGEVAP